MSSQLAFAPSRPSARIPVPGTVSSPVPSACECSRTFNLQCEQGQTLSSQISITLDGSPVDVTGGTFQFTAKIDPSLPDSDPSTVKVDWTETVTSAQGITWLKIPAATTQGMQPVGYQYQVRYVSSGGIVTPIVKGVLTIVQPISSRFV